MYFGGSLSCAQTVSPRQNRCILDQRRIAQEKTKPWRFSSFSLLNHSGVGVPHNYVIYSSLVVRNLQLP